VTDAYRVVIVEDDPDVAQYAKTILEKRGGCIVRTTGDPFAAQALVAEFIPDVVLTDIEMPGMTGLTLMEQIRQTQPFLPIIVMTAHISVDYAVAALRAQADEFLTKPIGAVELVEVVQRLAADGRASRESSRPREYVLAVGAHPDDVEIGVGGILASHRAAGDTVVILTMSRGAKGGDAGDRQVESMKSAERLGARLFLEDLVDTEITSSGPTVAIIERVVNEINPTIVYTHSIHDRHQDHRAVHEAVLVATRTVRTIACYQSPSSTVDFRPSRFVSIDGFTDEKLRLIECFRSQKDIRDYLDPEFVLATARYWGRFGGGTSVEPLEIVRETSDLSTPMRSGEATMDAAKARQKK
jgi:LmbE family N-acetylglucosaminyl deacetylase/CheY-like chemotaxis protein